MGSEMCIRDRLQALDHIPGVVRQRRNARRLLVEMMSVRRRERGVGDESRIDSRPRRLGGRSPKRRRRLRRIRRLWLNSWGGGLNRNPTPGVGRHVLNSSTTAACRICSLFWAFQNHRSLRYRSQGVIMLSRARYSWPGSNYPVMLDDCRAGPPPSAASAAEASLPDPVRASFLSGVSPLPGSRPRLSMYAAPDMGPFSGAYAAGFFSLAEKSSLEKNLSP